MSPSWGHGDGGMSLFGDMVMEQAALALGLLAQLERTHINSDWVIPVADPEEVDDDIGNVQESDHLVLQARRGPLFLFQWASWEQRHFAKSTGLMELAEVGRDTFLQIAKLGTGIVIRLGTLYYVLINQFDGGAQGAVGTFVPSQHVPSVWK
ncbi:hypothetical protein C8J57DRAFT_1224278 [Mycena rebaudengoi]|nr:hypothetical protein C8J57DRAFT_1224278 [Mycena rebaudengoi]